MRTQSQELHERKVAELAAEYAQQGFKVVAPPRNEDLPFDLGRYVPDLLAEKGDEHYLIAVKTAGTTLSIDRLQELTEEVRRHRNWRLLLVTADDLLPGEFPPDSVLLPSWEQLEERFERARRLLKCGDGEAALLTLWAVLEGMLRLQAERAALPIERLPSSGLLEHLYSHGEISMGQFDEARVLLDLRDRVAHGFATPDVDTAATRTQSLILSLVEEWSPRSAAA